MCTLMRGCHQAACAKYAVIRLLQNTKFCKPELQTTHRHTVNLCRAVSVCSQDSQTTSSSLGIDITSRDSDSLLGSLELIDANKQYSV